MKYKGYIKIQKCPMEKDDLITPCYGFLKKRYGLTCAKYCPSEIINETSREVRLKLYHKVCLTDENHPSNLASIVTKKNGKGNGKIYPFKHYKKK